VFLDDADPVNYDLPHQAVHEHEAFFSKHNMVESPWSQQPNYNKRKDSWRD